MIHAFILFDSILIVLLTLTLAGITFVNRKSAKGFLREASRMLILYFVLTIVDLVASYIAANLLQIDVFNVASIMDYYRRAPVVALLMALQYSLFPLIFYFPFTTLLSIYPKPVSKQRRFWVGFPIIVVMIWVVCANIGIPLGYLLDFHATEIYTTIRQIDNWILLPFALVYLGTGSFLWVKHRQRVEGELERHLGDRLVISVGVTTGAGLILAILASIPVVSNTAVIGSAITTLGLFLENNGLMILLVTSSIAWYLIESQLKSTRVSGETAPAAVSAEGGWQEVSEEFCRHYQLTAREIEICRLMALGLSNKDICERLGISHGTVKNHVSRIFGKLVIESRFELLACLRTFAKA